MIASTVLMVKSIMFIYPHLQSREKLGEICLVISLSKLVSVKNGIMASLFCGQDKSGSCNLRNASQFT